MIKVFKMENLDCANCAAKMENAIKKIEGVTDVNVNFLTQKLTLDADDDRFEDIVKNAAKACRRIDADCKITL